VTTGGFIEPEAICDRLRPETLLVSIMHANNETGVLQPLEDVGQLLANRDVVFHVDAAQTYGKDVDTLNRVRCDLLAISGHKIYGPQGVGALWLRKMHRPCLKAILLGGGQERGLRSGTVPVALIVGLGKAAELALIEHGERREKAASVKRAFLAGINAVEYWINGDVGRSQAHVVNVTFPGVDSEALMMQLKDVAAISNGSACTTSQYSPSHVLKAMGIPDAAIECAVRISWGPGVQAVPTDAFVDAVKRLRFKAT
jgi:cysteine desulfurase